MTYKITEVDGVEFADEILRFNALFRDTFEELKPRHLEDGYWWLVHCGIELVGFTGVIPFIPFSRAGYYKRAAVLKEHRGQGLQRKMMAVREAKARADTDWTYVYSDCNYQNVASANNFIRAGFLLVEVERPWEPNALFWRKKL